MRSEAELTALFHFAYASDSRPGNFGRKIGPAWSFLNVDGFSAVALPLEGSENREFVGSTNIRRA
jgi:hypothetical protein